MTDVDRLAVLIQQAGGAKQKSSSLAAYLTERGLGFVKLPAITQDDVDLAVRETTARLRQAVAEHEHHFSPGHTCIAKILAAFDREGEPDAPAPAATPRIPYGQEPGDIDWTHGGKPCHDCGVHVGELHTEGCDVEHCETCHGQRIGCYCCKVCRSDADTYTVCQACIDKIERARPAVSEAMVDASINTVCQQHSMAGPHDVWSCRDCHRAQIEAALSVGMEH